MKCGNAHQPKHRRISVRSNACGRVGSHGATSAGAAADGFADSSQPPSSDLPTTRSPRQRRTVSGRKPGGQPGHYGQTRALLPLEDVEAVLPVKPTHCARCQHPLDGEDGQPQRHQVTDLPPVQPVVTEYQLHSLVCPACGATCAPPSPLGCRLGALVHVCSHRRPVYGGLSPVETDHAGRHG